ncbi:MAG: hypothetical protein IJ532_03210 [Alphaproteobacteria bacterium]|nr:hypothetical protein [Alphaproteobacteria bacterium]
MEETKKINKNLMNVICGAVVAVIATAASYSYWHDTNIRVTFHADSEKELNYQVFYTDNERPGFNEKQSVRQIVPAGSHCVKIVVPTEKIGRFRLDPGAKPEKLTIKNLKVSGDETIEFTDFDNYKYLNIKEHTANEDGSLTIVSDHGDPYIVTTEELDILPGDDYDWLRMWSIFGGSFIVAFLLAMLVNRKKK